MTYPNTPRSFASSSFASLTRASRLALLSLALPLLGGCPNTENTTETDGSTDPSATEGVSSTGVVDPTTSTTADTDPTSTSTDSGTEGATDSSATATTVDATEGETIGGETLGGTVGETEGESETGVVPAELEMACKTACENLVMCEPNGPFRSVEECTADCAAEAPGAEECLVATIEFNECLGSLNCEQVQDALQNDELGPCTKAFEQLEESCAGNLCVASEGSNEEMTECTYELDCDEQPLRELKCAGDTCSCLLDGEQTAECDAMGICADPDQSLADFAAECCGF